MITSLNDNRLNDLGNGSLLFDPLALKDSGNYHCYIIEDFMIKDVFVDVIPFQGSSGRIGERMSYWCIACA